MGGEDRRSHQGSSISIYRGLCIRLNRKSVCIIYSAGESMSRNADARSAISDGPAMGARVPQNVAFSPTWWKDSGANTPRRRERELGPSTGCIRNVIIEMLVPPSRRSRTKLSRLIRVLTYGEEGFPPTRKEISRLHAHAHLCATGYSRPNTPRPPHVWDLASHYLWKFLPIMAPRVDNTAKDIFFCTIFVRILYKFKKGYYYELGNPLLPSPFFTAA